MGESSVMALKSLTRNKGTFYPRIADHADQPIEHEAQAFEREPFRVVRNQSPECGPVADHIADQTAQPAYSVGQEPPPDPATWRSVVGAWPIEWRQRWGDLANELMLGGAPWPYDEFGAFRRVSVEKAEASHAEYRAAAGRLTGWD
jgi:hypothetical protein